MKTVTEKSYSEYKEDEVSATLRATSASIGGVRGTGHLLYTDTVGALCARDYKGVGNEYAEQDKLVVVIYDIPNESGESDGEWLSETRNTRSK